jgi:hypothetical protein
MNKREAPERPEHDAAAGKQPYERPAVISEEVFETLALSCGPGPTTCILPPDQS